MIRKIIKIDEDKCNGCGLCVNACHEGAIALINGKAKLVREDFCDGLGNCLPACPTGAISIEEREATPFDGSAVKAAQQAHHGCPGSNSHFIAKRGGHKYKEPDEAKESEMASRLMQWPVQIKLVPVNAPYFDNANLLIAADCSAYAYGNFHTRFMKNRITLIGCPKLDRVDYSEKLTAILQKNNIRSVTVVRMNVPCCGGIEYATIEALKNSGKMIPWQVVTISTDGEILDN